MLGEVAAEYATQFTESGLAEQPETMNGAFEAVESFLAALGCDLTTAPEPMLQGLLLGLVVQAKTLSRAAPDNIIEAVITYAEISVIYWTMQQKGWA